MVNLQKNDSFQYKTGYSDQLSDDIEIQKNLENLKKELHHLQDLQQDLVEKINHPFLKQKQKSKPLRKTLLKVIYPGTALYSAKGLQATRLIWVQKLTREDRVTVYKEEYGIAITRSFESEVTEKKAKRIAFYTEDQIKLDGCIVYGDLKEHQLNSKKMMVMALGNAFTWQQAYAHAQLMAQKFNCNILLYNPRGIGKSLGKTHYLQDAVIDCKAAISYALKEACLINQNEIDFQKLGVYGHSFGGAVSALALQELVKEQKISEEGIGLYINHHSFASLSSFVKGFTKTGELLGGLSRLILSIAGHHELKAKKAIKETKLASRVVVATAEKDELLGKRARLKDNLMREEHKENVIANQVTYISIPDYTHHTEDKYLIDYDEMRKKLDNSAQSSKDTLEFKKFVQLQAYHHALEEWAKY